MNFILKAIASAIATHLILTLIASFMAWDFFVFTSFYEYGKEWRFIYLFFFVAVICLVWCSIDLLEDK